MSTLAHYDWPGNVRELENAIEYAVILARDGVIEVGSLPQSVREQPTAPYGSPRRSKPLPLKAALREPERCYILRALRAAHWNKHHAAKKLRISRSTLYKKIKEYDLAPQV